MKSNIALQLFATLSEKEQLKFGKYLRSPYFNRREDVSRLYKALRAATQAEGKEALYAAVYPGEPYHNMKMNHLLNYFAEHLERFMALEELAAHPEQEQLLRCRAFRKRRLDRHFEQNLTALRKAHDEQPLRNAEYWLLEYQIQSELFSWQILRRRSGDSPLSGIQGALRQFFMLENLRWACTARSLQSLGAGASEPDPLSETAIQLAAQMPAAEQPALALLYESYQALGNPNDEGAFERIQSLLPEYAQVFAAGEMRDIYMSAINFCIRKHNRGERRYTREAFELYREALQKGILLENGILPKYTYNNIHSLAQVLGEQSWAREFLETYREFLPAEERDNIYRYNLAGYHFRRSEYAAVLQLLQQVEFTEVFINLDVRKMLLRSYFELEEWPALDSLLDSFQTYLYRQKDIGYHRESYLNLVKFTKKLANARFRSREVRERLRRQIQTAESVAEKEWILKKVKSG